MMRCSNMGSREGQQEGPERQLDGGPETMKNQLNDFKFTANPEACASIHNQGIVILHLGRGTMYSSNETGASIWRLIEQQLPLEAIAEQISGEYQISHATCREHLVAFLADLEQQALIHREVVS
jgi:Coenzyme PQQ synthesis protein D (PqqD)